MRAPWVRDELLSERSARLDVLAIERRAMRGMDRASVFRGRERDPAADRRCAAAFGLEGGECGCGELGCRACEVSPAGACPCAAPSCDHWPRQANTRFQGRRVRWKAPLGPASPPLGAVQPGAAGGPGSGAASGGYRARSVRPDDGIDVHAHMPAESIDDWNGDRSDVALAAADLAVVDPPDEFQAVCVSANPGFSIGSWDANLTLLHSTKELTELTLEGAGLDPRILPFAFVPSYEMVDVKASPPIDQSKVDEVEGLLEGDFVGIGELLVRGHGVDDSDHGFGKDPADSFELLSQAIVPYLELAARYDVPVLFHWDLLTTDADVDAAMSRQQLLDLLELVKNGFTNRIDLTETERRLPKIVIAHCGDGPRGGDALEADLEASSTSGPSYKDLLNTILEEHPTVWFDLSGMQVDPVKHLFEGTLESPEPLTALGEFLLRKMAAYPTRFLYGSDYGQVGKGAVFADALRGYEAFLDHSKLGPIDRRAFFRDNALEVLYSAPRKPVFSTPDFRERFDWLDGFEAPGTGIDIPPYLDRSELDGIERFYP